MPFWLRLFYVLWFLGTPTFLVGISIWAFIHRNDTMGRKVAPLFKTKIYKLMIFGVTVGFVCLSVLCSWPFIEDIPDLLTGNYKHTEGTPQEIWRKSKDFSEYVQINGKVIQFPFSSTMIMGKYLKFSVCRIADTVLM